MSIIIREKDLTATNKVSLPSLTKKELIKLSGDYRLTINYLYEKLNEDSFNSAKPSSTDAPWDKARKAKNDASFGSDTQLNSNPNQSTKPSSSTHKNKADQRKPRAKGFGRTQALHITDHEDLKPEACASCSKTFGSKDYKRYHAFHQIDLRKKESAIQYYEVIHTKYHLFEASCSDCETVTRTTLVPIKTNISHIKLSPRRLIGPELASIMIFMQKENGTSLSKISTTIKELYGISLSKGAICTAINEGGLRCEAQVGIYRKEAQSADLAHMDETSWKDCGNLVWLWVFVTSCTVVFMMGGRTKKMALEFLNAHFDGFLMSDGYQAYRHYKKRLRCWAHLRLKAKGLSESTIQEISDFGCQLLALLDTCIDGIYAARKNMEHESIKIDFAKELDNIQLLCEKFKDSTHPKAKALAREFLNDWEAIFRILDYPHLPLTNNEAERALRHWVILRKVILGTQSEIGRRATCAIASVIATAKKRKQNILTNIKTSILSGQKSLLNRNDRPLLLSG